MASVLESESALRLLDDATAASQSAAEPDREREGARLTADALRCRQIFSHTKVPQQNLPAPPPGTSSPRRRLRELEYSGTQRLLLPRPLPSAPAACPGACTWPAACGALIKCVQAELRDARVKEAEDRLKKATNDRVTAAAQVRGAAAWDGGDAMPVLRFGSAALADAVPPGEGRHSGQPPRPVGRDPTLACPAFLGLEIPGSLRLCAALGGGSTQPGWRAALLGKAAKLVQHVAEVMEARH